MNDPPATAGGTDFVQADGPLILRQNPRLEREQVRHSLSEVVFRC